MKKTSSSQFGISHELSRFDEKKSLVLKIHENIINCGKCNEGYIVNKDTADYCDCCKQEMLKLQELKDCEVIVSDPNYDFNIKERKQVFSKEPEAMMCYDCNTYFKTNIKGRCRCEKCFKEYTSDFIIAKEIFMDKK